MLLEPAYQCCIEVEIPEGKFVVRDTWEYLIIFNGDSRKNDGEAKGLFFFFF